MSTAFVFSQNRKEEDFDINYDESKVPVFVLPGVLELSTGTKITTPENWYAQRRPEIVSLFSNLIYGKIPVPIDPIKVTYRIENLDSDYSSAKGTKKEVIITLKNSLGEKDMRILVITPNNVKRPVPAFMIINFNTIESRGMQLNKEQDRFNNGWPIGQLLDNGFAFVSVYHEDLLSHNEVEFNNSIQSLFYGENQSFPLANEWGVLATCGYGASLALDYLETVIDIDHTKVALMGHSKLGKAALWAAARDQRFGLAISANSGCAGAALWRRKYGETLEKMCTRFPYWLCYNAQKFIGREEDLPIDQHMLLSLIAPRPVYIASSANDSWADPVGEYLSAYYASEVYQLLGKKGLQYMDTIPINKTFIEQEIGFHYRSGGHYISESDWDNFIKFATYHFK